MSSAIAESTSIEVEGKLETLIPPELRSLHIENPYVDFKIDVGEDGTLFDAMPTKAVHRDLLPAAHEVVQAVTFIPAAKRRMYAKSSGSYVYQMSDKDELDSPLTQLLTTRRIYSSQNGVSTKGRCLVEYFVGPNGRARFPRAIESDNNDVAISAAFTLLKTRFNPPRKNGHPTYVRVKQDFEFR